MNKKGEINKKNIKKIIPYREPFLFIDKVIKLNKKEIVAEKKITKDYNFFKGHFVGFPLMPGALTLEALGQAATLLVRYNIKGHEKKDILATNIDTVEFFIPLFPDNTITLKAKIDEIEGNRFHCSGEVLKQGRTVCKGKILFVAVDKSRFRKTATG